MLKKVQTNGNPLTNMMARNLKIFLKIGAEVKRKTKRELENYVKEEEEAAELLDARLRLCKLCPRKSRLPFVFFDLLVHLVHLELDPLRSRRAIIHPLRFRRLFAHFLQLLAQQADLFLAVAEIVSHHRYGAYELEVLFLHGDKLAHHLLHGGFPRHFLIAKTNKLWEDGESRNRR